MLSETRDGILGQDVETAKKAMEKEDIVDDITLKIQLFLDRITMRSDESWQQARVNTLRNSIIDMERVSDHANNICEAIIELHESGMSLGEEEIGDVKRLFDRAYEAYETSLVALKSKKIHDGKRVLTLEDDVDHIDSELREKYSRYCFDWADTLQHTILIEVIRDLERVGDHANNIADNILDVE